MLTVWTVEAADSLVALLSLGAIQAVHAWKRWRFRQYVHVLADKILFIKIEK